MSRTGSPEGFVIPAMLTDWMRSDVSLLTLLRQCLRLRKTHMFLGLSFRTATDLSSFMGCHGCRNIPGLLMTTERSWKIEGGWFILVGNERLHGHFLKCHQLSWQVLVSALAVVVVTSYSLKWLWSLKQSCVPWGTNPGRKFSLEKGKNTWIAGWKTWGSW